MQDEIARTLTTIQWVKGARVQLSIPEPSLFTETEKPVTASIMIQVKRGFVPEVNQVKGISLLVARAVPGLREKKRHHRGQHRKTPDRGCRSPSSPLKNYLSTHINGKDAWSAGRINQGKEIEQETLIRG